MQIGTVTIDNQTILAPLAGITNLPFRLIAKEAGCGLVYSEMISAHGLVYGSPKTLKMLDSAPQEKPLSVQIFGSDPDIMARAAEIVENAGADILDINFGCSVKKIVKTGSGVALMREPRNAEAVLTAVRHRINIPLTIKIRSGWTRSGEQAFKIAEIAQYCGVDAIAMHPRTATQGFSGHADWSLISALAQQVSIPVIGNGDIIKARDALLMFDQTGCDSVMIGRAAIGNPWIFRQIDDLLKTGETAPIDLELRFQTMRRYLTASVRYFGEKRACYMMRSRLGWYTKGLPHSSKFREAIKRLSSKSQAEELIQAYRERLAGEGNGLG
jgi:nifR3 family TIM-barrel protein